MRAILKVKKRIHTYFVLKFDYDEHVVDYVRYIPSSKYNDKLNIWTVIYSDLTAEYMIELMENYDFRCHKDLYSEIIDKKRKASKNKKLSSSRDGYIDMPKFPYDLYGFQKSGVDYMLRTKRCFNADDMGLGKTIQSICAIETAKLFPVIIVVPKICIDLDTWREEIYKWIPHRKCSYINSENYSYYDDIQIINYSMTKELVKEKYFSRGGKKVSNFKKNALLKEINPKCVIFDESQYIKNSSSKRTKYAETIAKGVDYVFLLSGTPVENRPKELIPQLRTMKRLKDFGGWKYFTNRYCDAKSGYGGSINYDGSSNLVELNGKLRSVCYVRREKEDVIHEMPEKYSDVIPVKIDNMDEYKSALEDPESWIIEEKKRKAKKEFKNYDLFEPMNIDLNLNDEFEDSMNESAMELQIINALRIICSRGKFPHSLKYIKMLLNNGKKVAVSSNRIETQQKLIEEFPKAPTILGGMNPSIKKENYKRFQNDKDCKIIICSLKASNFAINLHSGQHNVTMELDWNPKIHEQFEDRQHRIGQKKDVHCHYPVAKDTIDENMKELLDKKSLITNEVNKGVENESMFSIKDELIKIIKNKSGVLV